MFAIQVQIWVTTETGRMDGRKERQDKHLHAPGQAIDALGNEQRERRAGNDGQRRWRTACLEVPF